MSQPTKEHQLVILLAEDDPDDVLLTKDAFSDSQFNGQLKVVEDGEQVLDYLYGRRAFKEQPNPRPNLILLDLNMPKMDGREVLRRIKSDPDLKAIPVVVLSTSSQPEDIWESYKLGSNSFITKPVKHEEFVKTMELLGRYWFKTVEQPVNQS